MNGSLNLSRALGDMEYKQSAALGPEAQIVYCRARGALLTPRHTLQAGDLRHRQSAALIHMTQVITIVILSNCHTSYRWLC